MELTWAGYRIMLRVQRERADRRRLLNETQACEPQLSEERRDAQAGHSLACGNRYVAPNR